MEKKITLFNLAIPIFGELVLFVMLGIVDVIMLTKVSDQAAGAVGATNQIISLINIIFSIISAGTGVLVSQYIGAKEKTEGHKAIVVSLVVISMVGILCSFALVIFGEPILKLIGISEGLMSYAKTYINIVGGFMFVQSILNVSTVTMRTYGYAKQTLAITAGMNVINIIGDAVLIFGLFGLPKLGVAGVAIATSGSRTIAATIALIYIFRKIVPISTLRHIKEFPFYILRKLLKVGLPAALENMSYNLSQIVISSIILYNLGETMYITRTYVWTMCSIAFIFSIAIGQANQMIVGRLVGEKKFDEAYHACLKNFKVSFYIAVVIGIVFYFFGSNIMELFTDNPEIIMWGGATAMVNAFLEPGRTFNIVIINGLRGSGDVIFPVVMAMIFMWGIAVLGSYFFGVILGWGLPGIWFALLLDEWTRGFIMYGRWRSKKWTTKSLVG
ncbi:MAG: MATE family efflux transporter [Vallitaleaceae bacterium]|jgi:putative MATE family efflux protein|nr:MATE family efflux transporter [Vallitaleaceae bacterium]